MLPDNISVNGLSFQRRARGNMNSQVKSMPLIEGDLNAKRWSWNFKFTNMAKLQKTEKMWSNV